MYHQSSEKFPFVETSNSLTSTFNAYGKLLSSKGYNPTFLFLRTDNLPAAIGKCVAGGWKILMGKETFNYIKNKTEFNLEEWLIAHTKAGTFKVDR